ncbi:molecular chaperone HtpG [Candidatus Borkfalkia ceftriaxoniphila]|uniref:Molecular chaperone HtpG n=1 Tax=Candidatus Borkfalkia ceftriaxoniphila TaxID=2508949 RepID=A0A4Q2K6Z2_9FIRM|nr:molecular chaperone HtpG [Candidatus Borkfalkia ceftriaxoniphila]RXZ57901.1 molecular chaperone HtpG [Candidatus Borkfalkia ceftriaxoniphila]
MSKQGNIRIASENMMPIIKKWLYSDKDIFLREIVANGVDAITKFRKLADMGEAQTSEEEYCIKVSIDKDAKTLSVEDNGIGMTEDEVEKYITQIAFSGAADFLDKYEKADGDGIIGHFGLGFYSAYMVSENIEIFTKSYRDEPAVRWESDGESTYTIEPCDKETRGTKIVMHIADAEKEFLDEGTISTLIHKYCGFMPYNIYLNFQGKDDKPLNDPQPLYIKNPKDCTDEEYKSFYTKTFHDFQEPLFWIHLNMDYPFRLKGILYFPKVKNKAELERGQVKLFCNQVFIADNIKEVIPEFLTLLNGVIDCPDIPLNVSRSFLQNDREVQKISRHITKKVADKLTGLFKNDREKFVQCWNDISVFIKVGCLKDEDFYSKVKDILIFKDLNGEYKNLDEFLGVVPESETAEEKRDEEKKPVSVYYVSDEVGQSQYVNMFKNAGLNAIVCDTFVDPHFISFLEYKNPEKWKFMRIDADIDSALKDGEVNADDFKDLTESFKNSLKNTSIAVKAEKFKSADVPAIINVSEFTRRFSEMNAFYGLAGGDADRDMTIILNTENPVVASFTGLNDEMKKFVANQIYYIAMLSYKKLNPEELKDFSDNSMQLLKNYIG